MCSHGTLSDLFSLFVKCVCTCDCVSVCVCLLGCFPEKGTAGMMTEMNLVFVALWFSSQF